jgi:hypothetical protein
VQQCGAKERSQKGADNDSAANHPQAIRRFGGKQFSGSNGFQNSHEQVKNHRMAGS